jgi:hypothetical protein
VRISACINSVVSIWADAERRQANQRQMEGLGEDSEPQVLARFAKDLQHSIHQTESALVQHLQENQEAMRKGQLLRFGYLGKWSPCAYESLSTKGEDYYPHTLL